MEKNPVQRTEPVKPQVESASPENTVAPPQFKLASGGNAGGGDAALQQNAAVMGQKAATINAAKEDPLKVSEGQLTFDAEGNDNAKSAYFTRVVHWPGGVSGVTLGRGYDFGQRGKDATIAHLDAAGITGAQKTTLLGAVGLTGKAAGDWVKANKAKVGEITHDQQKTLFEVVYGEHADDVKRLSNKKDVKDKYGTVDFAKLHPAIMDLLVDLRYRGDYHSRSRAWIQPLAVKNDLKGMAAAMADEKWKTDYGVPEDRFRRRKEYMAAALKGGAKPDLTAPDTTTKPKTESTAPGSNETGSAIDSGSVTATSLNVRSGPGPTHAKVGDPLSKGASVKVYEKSNGWFRIGKGQWVSGEYVELTGKKDAPATAAPTKPAVNTPTASGTVTASTLNVRAGAGASFEKVDTLKNGAAVQIFEEKDGWLRIGPARWVSGEFVQKGSGKPAPKPNKPAASGTPGEGMGPKPDWISTAEGEIGVSEEKAKGKHNQRIIDYHATTGKFKDDETPWCASFVNWVMGKKGNGSASALSFKSWGKKVAKPAYGAVGVIDWGGGKGHVGFVVGKQNGKILLLGGNQGDSVKVSSFAESLFVAFRMPTDYEVPAAAYNLGGAGDKIEDGGGVHATR
jgi:uncharacterized protein (TIGR02594 family)